VRNLASLRVCIVPHIRALHFVRVQTMQLFFFDIIGRDHQTMDSDGLLLESPDAARSYAERIIRELLQDKPCEALRVRIRDSGSRELVTMALPRAAA
jgi:hypothetical protein